jgi:hypothetical protein
MIKIPVNYVDRPGFTSLLLSEKSPTIEVVIGFIPEPIEGDPIATAPKLFTVRALVDTGADDIFVDERLLAQCGCPKIGTTDVRSTHRTTGHDIHKAHILFPAWFLCQPKELPWRKHQSNRRMPLGIRWQGARC